MLGVVNTVIHCRCVYPYILAASFFASFVSATIINFERCISIFCPMRYHFLVTNKRLISICAIQYMLAIVFALMKFNIPMPESGFYCESLVDISLSITDRIILDVILLCNIFAYILMIWHFKTQRQQNAVVPLTTTRKALRKFTLVSIFLFLCYTPVLIASELQARLPDVKFVQTAKAISRLLAVINSNMNPVLYVWRFYEVRFQFLSLLCFWNKSKLDRLRQKRRTYFATFDMNTIDRNANFRNPSPIHSTSLGMSEVSSETAVC